MAEPTDADRQRAEALVEAHTSPYYDTGAIECDDEGLAGAIAAALAEERERAIEVFVILADEMEQQVAFRRETNASDEVAAVREVDLRWLRLAISNAKDPR